MKLGEARTPDGMRIYAIGDVHGMDRMLAEAHQKIAGDLRARPVEDYRIVHAGDYIDRGPDSAGVIERLARLQATDDRIVCLVGNHDAMMLSFLADPVAGGPDWLTNGGGATLRSYGIDPPATTSLYDLADLRDALAAALPPQHQNFLNTLKLAAQSGDFFFCHAGVLPGVPLEAQSPDDLLWIREPFLSSGDDHGAVVIHGHTPVRAPEVRPNRVNIDTGAVFGGPLTVLVLEEAAHRFL